jgi:hypothetical protein
MSGPFWRFDVTYTVQGDYDNNNDTATSGS